MKKDTKILLSLAALLAMTLLPKWSSAQDIIREAQYEKTRFSLVTERIPYKRWIAYNDNSYVLYFSFGVFDTTGSYSSFIRTQQQFHVKDMTLVSNILYFCGYMLDSTTMTNVGIMGYFNIDDMPSPTINYVKFDTIAVLRKLEYYSANSTKHVAMVGTGKDGRDYIADAYYYYGTFPPSYGTWGKAWTYMPNVDALFDDISVLDTNVVVSARIADSSVVNLCYITKTPSPREAFFESSNIQTKKLDCTPKGRVLLQKGNYDTVYAIYRSSDDLLLYQMKSTQKLTSRSISYAPFIGPFQGTVTLLDVNTDQFGKNINVLVYYSWYSTSNYKIYHIPISHFTTGGTLNTHVYSSNNTLYSLGRGTNHTSLAAGENYLTGCWSLFKNQNTASGSCASLVSTSSSVLISNNNNLQTKYHSMSYSGSLPSVMPVSSYSVTTSTICH